MTKQDRTTLKSFFRDGALPTAEHFRDLIDSSVNQVEDGFLKTPTGGLELNSVGSSLRVMSLYQGLSSPAPSWVVEHGNTAEGQDPGALHFRPMWGAEPPPPDAKPGAPAAAGLCLTRDGRAGVDVGDPRWRLDVAGVVRMTGRIGVTLKADPDVPADGDWHDITPSLTGCQAFEVMAGAGGPVQEGRYALLHAIAMNAYHPRNPILNWLFGRRRIRAQTAVYGSYADRLRLRWIADGERHHFKLQLRSNADYGEGIRIRYYLMRLWFDTRMEGSRRSDVDRDEGLL
ncbi:hypothetical protein [Rhodovulum steppense]|uniref:Uncharacterized protein n=1 Tax=Rhodovulum steppense TaxID=540251 RepID=A0A4R1YY13_9RHOB|nr:hypothetical protein [Rhodovulum steppense]TCM86120.1 hypothetical protein EV216_10585 [Rhodovulum steppense]